MTTTESVSPSYSFYPFSTSTLNDILGKFSELSIKNIVLGYMFMVRIGHYLFLSVYHSISIMNNSKVIPPHTLVSKEVESTVTNLSPDWRRQPDQISTRIP